MNEKDVIRTIKLQRAPDGTLGLMAMIESCFVDDAGAVIATKPNPALLQVPIAGDDPALQPLLGFIAARRKAEIDAAAAEVARVAAEKAAAEIAAAAAAAEKAAAEAAQSEG